MNDELTCWCGQQTLAPFSDDYWKCPGCGCLVFGKPTKSRASIVRDDGSDFYGRTYWFEHQQKDLGLPDITVRSISDLPERCLYWMQSLLDFKLPPASVLEVGCGHGGTVALMRRAGFDAIGMELSPWVVEFARQAFDIPVLQGPVETGVVDGRRFDAILMFDVLEHLRSPIDTIRYCEKLLKPDGIFVIQTPKVPPAESYDQLIREDGGFVSHLHPEHLFLFTYPAAKKLFESTGFRRMVQLTPLYPHDMFFVASKQSFNGNHPAAIEEKLLATSDGRLIHGMLTLYRENRQLRRDLESATASNPIIRFLLPVYRKFKRFLAKS